MIIGNPNLFALESEISEAYELLSLRALGFFAIYVNGQSYGIKTSNATLLSLAFDGVQRRIAARGSHCWSAITGLDARTVAEAYIRACYLDHEKEELFLGMRDAQVIEVIHSRGIVWAPDGEEGFDDGTYVLQFDVGDQVRLIAFTRVMSPLIDPGSLREVWLAQDDFYRILQDWHTRFEHEWMSLPKHAQG